MIQELLFSLLRTIALLLGVVLTYFVFPSLIVLVPFAFACYKKEDFRTKVLQTIFKESNCHVVKANSSKPVHSFNPAKNRRWILKKYAPTGTKITADMFEFTETARPKIQKGEVLVRNKYLSFEPSQRFWLQIDDKIYRPPIQINGVMESLAVSEVVESSHPSYSTGDIVFGTFGWEDFSVFKPTTGPQKSPEGMRQKIPKGISPYVILTAVTDLTAIAGMLRIGKVKSGDRVLVSAAAGATGSVAGQIAKALGASKVVGIAGGPEKTKLIKDNYKFDETIDYKSDDVDAKITEIFGNDKINVYFDNVGGDILDSSLKNMARGGRVVICGSISQYESERKGIKNIFSIIGTGSSIQGFLVMSFMKDPGVLFRYVLYQFLGKYSKQIDLRQNFDNLPNTLMALFASGNTGKLLLEMDA